MIKHLALAVSVVALLAGCGSDPDVLESSTTTVTQTDEPSLGATTTSSDGRIVESGFGQSGEYAWVIAMVKNESDHAGQTVTVNFNLRDKGGQLIASGSQVASFNWPGQTLPVGTQIDVTKGEKASTIEATVLVEDDDTFDDQVVDKDWGTFPGRLYSSYGSWGAKFEVKNPTPDALKSPAVEVVCHDAGGQIIGGSSAYPELVPPAGSVLVDVSDLYTHVKPHDCVAYLHPWM